MMGIEATFECAYCGEVCHTTADNGGGRVQQYTEDCHVCCRPNLITCEIVTEEGVLVAFLESEQEYEA